VQLAEIALDQATPGAAESLARRAASVFDKNQAFGSASLAYSILARSLLVAGKIRGARAAADHAAALAQQGSDRMVRIQAGLAQAEVETLSGKSAAAERNLNALLDQAKHLSYTVLELKARLLLAKADLQSGQRAAARARLNKLQSDARSKGFLLIARQASVSLPPSH
jgi:ATP/maltotriose-dependent transcriptional regulator MalT